MRHLRKFRLYFLVHLAPTRVRPKFGVGFGDGAETDLTYGFGIVSATAKVQWHEFGFGRNIMLLPRNAETVNLA